MDMSGTQKRFAILIVDDEPSLRDILSQILHGYEVTAVRDGTEAIRILSETTFEMVITDLMMPQVDGFAVLATAKKANPNGDVLVLTGYPSLENERRCRAMGCTDILAKPFGVTAIRARVEECLRTREGQFASH
jgi:DNA-binding response OmpR family regulator